MTRKKIKHTVKGDLARLGQLFNDFNETAMRILVALDIEGKAAGYCNNPKISKVQQIVADHYRVPISVMTSRLKPNVFVEPRHVAMTLCSELTNFRSAVIGSCFNRDHSSVLYARQSVRDRMKCEPDFANQFAAIRMIADNELNSVTPKTAPILPLQFSS